MAIDIALLGCGHPEVADVLGVIASEPDVRLAAAWDSNRSQVPPPIRDYAVADPETAIGRATAVVICAPAAERPVLCARAARAGRPTLVQVPVAPDAEQAGRLARELARNRTPVMAALPLRELAALRRLRDAVRAGVLGRVSGVDAGLVAPDPAPVSRSEPGRPGWGFIELAIHLVDALAALGEAPRLDAVSLDGGDLGGAALGRWGGAPLTLRANLVGPERGLRLTLDGARATAVLRDGALELRDGGGGGDRWIGGPPDAGEPVRAFAERLRRRAFPRDSLAGAVRAQLVAERTQRLD